MIQRIKSGFKNATRKANALAIKAKCAFESKKAEGYVDSGVKILIAVVIGALLLAGLYALFESDIMPTVTNRIRSFFNYNGHFIHGGGSN